MNTNKITVFRQKKLSDSVPINNNPNVLSWLVDCQMKSYKSGYINLLKDLSSELEKLFGAHNKTLLLEFRTKIWTFKYCDLLFIVFCANGKGTSIELCGADYDEVRTGKNEKEIIQFLEELFVLVNRNKLKNNKTS